MTSKANRQQFEFDQAAFEHAYNNQDGPPVPEGITPLTSGPFVNADDVHRAVTEAQECGAIKCPESLEIMVFPGSIEEPDVCLVVVWSTVAARSGYVAAGQTGPRDVANRDTWESDDPKPRTEAMLVELVAMANSIIDQVRAVEQVLLTRRNGNS